MNKGRGVGFGSDLLWHLLPWCGREQFAPGSRRQASEPWNTGTHARSRFPDRLPQVLSRAVWSGPPNPLHSASLRCSHCGIHHRKFYLGERGAHSGVWVHSASTKSAGQVPGLAYQSGAAGKVLSLTGQGDPGASHPRQGQQGWQRL